MFRIIKILTVFSLNSFKDLPFVFKFLDDLELICGYGKQ